MNFIRKDESLLVLWADVEDPKEISGEGLERMFADLNVDMETVRLSFISLFEEFMLVAFTHRLCLSFCL